MADPFEANSGLQYHSNPAPKKRRMNMDAFQRAFGTVLHDMRRKRKKTQQEFSIPQRTIRRIEKGDAQLTSTLEFFRELKPCRKEALSWMRLVLELLTPECQGCDPDCRVCDMSCTSLADELEKYAGTSETPTEAPLFKNLLDLNPYGIAIWDEEGRYVKGNQAYLDLFKQPPPEFVTLFDSPPLRRAGMQGLFLRLKEGEALHFSPFWHNSREAGEQYPDNPICIGAAAFPLTAQGGRIRYYVTMFEDITKRVLAEERLKEALQFKSDFMATVSHELRTPLSGIIGSASLVLQDSSFEIPERRVANIKNVLGNADKLVSMINNILDVARMETGGTRATPQYFSIAEVIKASIELFQGLIDEKSIEASWDVDQGIPILFNDRRMIGQIVNNLVGNAVKFTDSGGVRVAARLCEDDHNKFVMTVEDTGIGIQEDKLHKIFEHFAMADTSITRRHYGIGMGLAIVNGYVNLLGGEIEVESRQMAGSKFTVTLPIALDTEIKS